MVRAGLGGIAAKILHQKDGKGRHPLHQAHPADVSGLLGVQPSSGEEDGGASRPPEICSYERKLQEEQREVEGGQKFSEHSLLLAAAGWKIHNKTADRKRDEKEKKEKKQNAAVPA